jgi:hypothetical protein
MRLQRGSDLPTDVSAVVKLLHRSIPAELLLLGSYDDGTTTNMFVRQPLPPPTDDATAAAAATVEDPLPFKKVARPSCVAMMTIPQRKLLFLWP